MLDVRPVTSVENEYVGIREGFDILVFLLRLMFLDKLDGGIEGYGVGILTPLERDIRLAVLDIGTVLTFRAADLLALILLFPNR